MTTINRQTTKRIFVQIVASSFDLGQHEEAIMEKVVQVLEL